jgi:hypothetical protein
MPPGVVMRVRAADRAAGQIRQPCSSILSSRLNLNAIRHAIMAFMVAVNRPGFSGDSIT